MFESQKDHIFVIEIYSRLKMNSVSIQSQFVNNAGMRIFSLYSLIILRENYQLQKLIFTCFNLHFFKTERNWAKTIQVKFSCWIGDFSGRKLALDR